MKSLWYISCILLSSSWLVAAEPEKVMFGCEEAVYPSVSNQLYISFMSKWSPPILIGEKTFPKPMVFLSLDGKKSYFVWSIWSEHLTKEKCPNCRREMPSYTKTCVFDKEVKPTTDWSASKVTTIKADIAKVKDDKGEVLKAGSFFVYNFVFGTNALEVLKKEQGIEPK